METFVPYINPFVPGCPTVLIERKVLEATRIFCEDAWIWRKTVEYTTSADDPSKDLSGDVDTGAEIIEEIEVTLGGSPWNKYSFGSNTIVYDDAMSGESDIKIILAQRPLLATTELPTIFLSKHLEAIKQRTLMILYLMKDKSWYDPNLYRNTSIKYSSELARARIGAIRKNNTSDSCVKMRKFV